MSDKQAKVIRILSGVLFFIALGVMFFTHRKVPFMMDDLWYSTILSEDTPIRNFSDILQAQIWHYNNWGGRSMTHTILQLTLLLGEFPADVLNIVMTVLLCGMICIVAGYSSAKETVTKSVKTPWLLAAAGMVLGLNANWKMSMFWQAGSANYLYITTVILVFVLLYLKQLPEENGEEAKVAPWKEIVFAILILPLAVLTGWSNENMGPAVFLMAAAVMVLRKKAGKKNKVWMFTGAFAELAGSVLMIIAPGNFVRSAESDEVGLGLLWKLFLRGYAESKAVLEFLFPTLLTLFVVLVLVKCLHIRINAAEILLLVTAVLSWGAMVLSPHYPDRATFGTMVLLICVIFSLARKIIKERPDMGLLLWIGSLLIWLRGMYFCGEFLAICFGWIK